MGLKGWVQLEGHAKVTGQWVQLLNQPFKGLKHRLSAVERPQLAEDGPRLTATVEHVQKPGLLGLIKRQRFQRQAVVLNQCRSHRGALFLWAGPQDQVHQIGVPEEQSGLVTGAKAEGFDRPQQQRQQFHLCCDVSDPEEFHSALEIFFDAEPAFIGDAALEHRSGGPQSQRTGSRCQPGAGGSGDRGGHFWPQAQGLIGDQSDHVTAGDRPSGLERVETFNPRGRDFVIPPLAVDSSQLFAEKTIVFNLPGIEIPGTSCRLQRHPRGFRLESGSHGRDLGRPEIRPTQWFDLRQFLQHLAMQCRVGGHHPAGRDVEGFASVSSD